MPIVAFTPALQRFLPVTTMRVQGTTVREALDAVFVVRSTLRGYLLDDQGALRRHVNVFVNGELVRDRAALSDQVGDGDEIYVFQALTGG
jgi:molybdopterin synthase sulfur carrier subunit